MNKEILMVVDAVSKRERRRQRGDFSKRSRRRWPRLPARNTAKSSMCACRSTARPATTTPSAAGRSSRTIRPSSKSPSASCASMTGKDIDPNVEIGGFVEQPIESVAFGRIAAQQAKQVIVQKVREAERAQVGRRLQGSRWHSRERRGSSASTGNGIYVDLGSNAEGFVPRTGHDPARAGEAAGPHQGLPERSALGAPRPRSCSCHARAPEFLIELFKLEVPEVGQGHINILGAARDAGVRAKIVGSRATTRASTPSGLA